MWRRPGQLPPLPLPPPTQRGPGRGVAVTRPEAPRAPRLRPVLSPRRLAHSSFASLAPALGRYSPPLCRGNKMAASAARTRCARIRPPPRRGPSSGGSVSRGGCARTGPPAAASPRPGFVCCGVPRAHVLDAHTPLRLGASRPARQKRSPSSPAPPFCPTPAPASRRVPGSGGGKRAAFVLTWRGELNPRSYADYREGLCGCIAFLNFWLASPPHIRIQIWGKV